MHFHLRLPDLVPVVLDCFWPNLYCTCAKTAIFWLLTKNSEIAIRFSDPNLTIWHQTTFSH